ncbi:MAG: GH25 family lysozyme [Oscillospiraceae bacterium]
MYKILDISKHQGTVDFEKMKSKGIDGVMCRCAYSGYKDSKFDEFAQAAQNANIPIGAYAFCTWHYSSFSVNKASAMIAAESEANKIIEILKHKKIGGPVAIDLELESGQSTLLTKEEMTCIANHYLDKLSNAGYTPLLYCSISWLFDKLNCTEIEYPLWVAYYNSAGHESNSFPSTKYGVLMQSLKDRICLWQYSSHGDGKSFGTSSERVDLNHCYIKFCTQSDNSSYDKLCKEEPALYTVLKGDALTSISAKHNILLNELIALNSQIKNPNLIYVGQQIKIPASKIPQSTQCNNEICVGCTVKLRQGAKTFDGKGIASFVFLNTYSVDQLKGNRAVLDVKGICTPVNTADLIKVNL